MTTRHKSRLDVLIFERGLAPSRERAQALLLAGQVRVNGTPMTKAGTQVAADARIEVVGETLRYASRGGLKLEGALADFAATPEGKVCLDVGSSTGGFTDCLLQHGATKVCAVDVTIDQLDWKLRQDSRVVTVERNARYLKPNDIAETVDFPGIDFVTMDVSFISVDKVLPAIVPLRGSARRIPDSDQAAIRTREARSGQRRNRSRRRASPESDRPRHRRGRTSGTRNYWRATEPLARHRGKPGVFSPRAQAGLE